MNSKLFAVMATVGLVLFALGPGVATVTAEDDSLEVAVEQVGNDGPPADAGPGGEDDETDDGNETADTDDEELETEEAADDDDDDDARGPPENPGNARGN